MAGRAHRYGHQRGRLPACRGAVPADARCILAALRDAANPFSILTKGTLILRDLPLLEEAAGITEVGLNVSVGSVDKELWRSIEPGTPAPDRRLGVCATLTGHGLRCGVLMGPVVPFLSDSPAQLEATVREIAAAGATHVTPIVLHLRPGAREWFYRWLGEHHPSLMAPYRALYRSGLYAPRRYQQEIADQVSEFCAQARGRPGRSGPGAGRRAAPGSQARPRRAIRAWLPRPPPSRRSWHAEGRRPAQPALGRRLTGGDRQAYLRPGT